MPKMDKRRDLLEAKLTELSSFIKDLSPESRVEISFEQYEDEDAHVRVYLPPTIEPHKGNLKPLNLLLFGPGKGFSSKLAIPSRIGARVEAGIFSRSALAGFVS